MKVEQDSSPAIAVHDLHVAYGPTVAVESLTFTIPQHTTVALLGKNGAGKTSAVEAILGLRAFSGSAEIYGTPVSQDRKAYAHRLGVMLQQDGLWLGAKPIELLKLYRKLYKHPLALNEVIEPLGLQPFLYRTIRGLSGGQAQRLNMALSLIGQPDLVILDEPTAAMDPQIRFEIWDWLRTFQRERGMTTLLTTHNMSEVEALADRIMIMHEGTLVASGSQAELLASMDVYIELYTTEHERAKAEITSAFAGSPVQLTFNSPDPATLRVHPGETTVFNRIMDCYSDFSFVCSGVLVHRPRVEDLFLSLTATQETPVQPPEQKTRYCNKVA